jgi:nicotinamide riboside transporter PnuC
MKKISWIGTIASVIGSFVVAFGAMLAGYSLFIVGSVSWLIVAAKRRDVSLAVLNGFFFMANLIGLSRAVF